MKKITLIICFIFTFILGACSTTVAKAEQTYPIKIWKHNENGSYETLCVVDEKTGVNYIVVGRDMHGDAVSVSITPRLNSDGTLYVTE